jgi:hypothetical protein
MKDITSCTVIFSGWHHLSGLRTYVEEHMCGKTGIYITQQLAVNTAMESQVMYRPHSIYYIFVIFYMYLQNLIKCRKLMCNYYGTTDIQKHANETTAHIQRLKDTCNYKIWGFMVAKCIYNTVQSGRYIPEHLWFKVFEFPANIYNIFI